jgi:hypothetical protein
MPDVPTPGAVATTSRAISLQREIEELRQEQDTFNQLKKQSDHWFKLRLGMGVVAALMLPSIFVVCCFLIYDTELESWIRRLAAGALLTDVLGLVVFSYKLILSPGSIGSLGPVTRRK